ncbi:Transcriptional regulator GlxA family, contains an amidase domain and an AraC-type DNA-binding HTH domain [Bosea lupini]|uniref:Transcriptional regulator GlxA family, contains an amidase domain and an AraC-type DNA-binding HTH domain n=1 Tax=Bosea lupini TaxID=1036779 RepID=A0A1H7HT56_9HYPH|nr:GlxA family transcriptional regulator [Bosea lupini]SEK52240.1 Transcriptional regulator GlxA family, contains an amidase domain and an AraC-type DNA-binding HTH domain [Bosea lupini]
MNEAPAGTQIVTLLLVEGFSMMSVASAIEPLRSLNRLVDREAWRWRLASLDGGVLAASNGIPIPTEAAETALPGSHYFFVCGGLRIQSVDERRYLSILRKAARSGVRVGSLSTGTYLLARAGLLDGYRSTIHWENRPAFQEEFPDLVCTDKLYEIDRDRMTCSGGTAAMDLMLHLITERHGADLARRVANQFHHDRIRDERDNQSGGRLERMSSLPPAVRNALKLMQRHVEDTISIAEIAEKIGMSPRQLERLFLRYLQTSPARYYLSLRIDRARELLLYSDRPVLEVAIAAGFTSTSHFAHWFKKLQGVRPSQLRGRPASEETAPASPS